MRLLGADGPGNRPTHNDMATWRQATSAVRLSPCRGRGTTLTAVNGRRAE